MDGIAAANDRNAHVRPTKASPYLVSEYDKNKLGAETQLDEKYFQPKNFA